MRLLPTYSFSPLPKPPFKTCVSEAASCRGSTWPGLTSQRVLSAGLELARDEAHPRTTVCQDF